MSKKSYKLTYFKARGRGEFIRLVFLVAGVEFEEHQVDFHEEWPSLKASKYLSRVLMACSVGFSFTCIFEFWGFDLQRSSKTEKLSFAIHTCCAYRQLRSCGRRGGGREWGRDWRASSDETTKAARVGDRMVIKITKNERNDKKKSNRVQDNMWERQRKLLTRNMIWRREGGGVWWFGNLLRKRLQKLVGRLMRNWGVPPQKWK